MAERELRILFVEDSPQDFELEERELRQAGLVFKAIRVETSNDFVRAIGEFKPDLIISDYTLPRMDGIIALRIAREACPDIPFLFVSGTLGEERAVHSLKEGATDYILKGRLGRLAHAVRRALQEAQDRIERRRLEEQFRQAQKMEAIGRLAGGVAHDFNNMLTAILGYGQIALGRLPQGEPVRADITEMISAGERAAALTRQLLAFSRKQVLQPKVLDLNKVVSELESMLRRVIGEHIDLKSTLAMPLGRVKADAGQLEQVLLNLVVNSRDSMPEGGTLGIETADVELKRADTDERFDAKPGLYIMVAVSDTGVGMDEETKAHLFEPFFTTKPAGMGTGLGLSTVFGIVTQSGGCIQVQSETGKGSTFKIFLPRVEAAPEPIDLGMEKTGATPGTETILVVEDADVVRNLVRDVLKEKGYRVLEANNGKVALELYALFAEPIHLVVTDLVMPGMGGRELASHLRALKPEVKVLFMSGYAEDAVAGFARLDEGTSFIAKPFTPDSLARKVRQVLSGAV